MRSNFAYDTEALWQQDRDHIIHPWIDLGSAKTREPLIVAAAEGVHIYDSRGHRMIDGIGGMWCVNIGYGREEMAQAMIRYVSLFDLVAFYAGLFYNCVFYFIIQVTMTAFLFPNRVTALLTLW